MKRLLPILMVIFALLMPTTLWAQGLAGDETDEPYAVLSEDSTVLTFYYDDQKDVRGGMSVANRFGWPDYQPWHSKAESITTAEFDPSFASCTTLTSTAYWFYECSNLTSITGIQYLKTDNVTDMVAMFYHCDLLTSLDVSGFKTDNVTDMSILFAGCSGLTSLDLSGFKTDNVTDMSGLFSGCSGLTSLDVSGFKTDNVTNMGSMFSSCSSLMSLDLSNFKTDNVTNMGSMFWKCSGLTSLDLSGFKTDNVTDMSWMFSGCSSLTSLVVSGFSTDNVTNMYYMFSDCSGLTSLDLSNFNTANVTNMSWMFSDCSGLTSLDLSGFKTDNVADMDFMFWNCSGLTSLDVSGFKTDNVTNMGYLFSGCSSLTSLDLSGFKTDNVTDMGYLFSGCSGLTSLDVSGFKTDNVTNMEAIFSGCSSLTSLDLSGFNTAYVTDMSRMFSSCSGMANLDVSNFKTDNVTDMGYLFSGCSGLTSLDLSGFKTDNVADMDFMFWNCSGLTSLDVSGFKTDNVTNMEAIFSGCSGLTSLDVSGFKTDNVMNMSGMFDGCSGLTSLDLSIFNTAKVADMRWMFDGCSGLTTIYVGDGWSTKSVTESVRMFSNCTNLVGGAGTTYNYNHADYTYAHIDGGTDNPGYFTAKDAKVWSVIGTINGEWDKDTEMTSEDGVNYTASFPYLAASSYEFKIRANSDWTENYGYEGEPGGKNIPVVVEENLTTVVVSFNADTKQIVYELQAPVYSIIGGKVDENGEPVNGWLNWAEDADMTKTESGQYVLKFDNMEAGSYQFKVRVNHEWTYNWGLDGKQDGENDILDLEHSVPVTFYFDPVTKITLVEVPVVDNDAEPYAVLSEENTVLTFYYDEKKAERNGMSVGPFDGNEEYPTWYNARESIKSIVFDNSFAKCESITSTAFWFFNCYNATSITGINNLNTSNVTNMSYMFGGCSVSDLDLSSFNTANVTNMYGMFSSCYGLHSLDLSSFNTAKVTDMGLMFQANEYLKHINLSSFNTANVTNMNGMFNVCTHLESLDVSSFNTENVKDMGWMFRSCPNLTSLDLSNFNTTNVTNMHYMFEKSSNLATIYVGSDWRTELVTDGTDMFKDCTSLVGGAGTIYDANHIDYTYAHIDEGASNPGYFTDKNAPVINVTLNEYGVLSVNSDVTMAEALEEASKKHDVEKWITAIVWNSNKPIANSELQSLTNPNMLIFVPADSLAPQNRDNVVIGDLAKNIVLKDVTEGNGSFYSPKSFKAEMISYTHEYRQQTEIGVARGWETIALPFTVQTIMHEKQGRIVPFGISDSGANFWLRQMTSNGLQRATQIEANVPYIISMPNNEAYYAQNNLAGRVTFSSQDAMVPMTEYTAVHMQVEGGMLMFVPCFQGATAGNMIYALNVGEARGNYPEGSVFEANYRDIRPFEAYTVHEGNYGPAPQYIPVFDLNEAGFTGIEEVRSQMSDGRSDVWYDLNGRRLQSEPTQKGVYLHNGRKQVVK